MSTELYYPHEGGGTLLPHPDGPDFLSEKLTELREECRRILGTLPVFSSAQEEMDFYRAWDTQMQVHHMDDNE